MEHLIEVAFKGNRREFFRWTFEAPPPARAAIIVETERGEDLGHVHATGELAGTRRTGTTHGKEQKEPLRLALRLASGDDITRANVNRTDDEEARRYAVQKARALNLQMKISDAEWQWDRRRLTFYFTAEERVDFRALVRQLETHFGVRVQMWHIGPRDEAKRLDGVGHCGRQLCSAAWLPELLPVKTSLAKDQRLSTITPTQISGACGRLMCCLRYEHEFYAQARKRFPKHGKIVTTLQGEEKVDNTDIFRDLVTLRSPGGDTRTIPLAQFKRELAGEAMPVEEETHDDEESAEEMTRDLVRTPDRPLAQLQRAPQDSRGDRRNDRNNERRDDRGARPDAHSNAVRRDDRPARQNDDRSAARRDDRPRDDRARNERGRDDRARADRPRDDNARGSRPRDDRPRDQRPREGDRPRDDRPRDDRPRDDRPRDDRPRPDRPAAAQSPVESIEQSPMTAPGAEPSAEAAGSDSERRARRRRGRRGGRRHRGPDGNPGGNRPPQNPE